MRFEWWLCEIFMLANGMMILACKGDAPIESLFGYKGLTVFRQVVIITWERTMLKQSSIQVRVTVSGEDGKPLQSSDLIQNAKPLEIVNLTVLVTGKHEAKRRIEGRIVLEHGLPAEKIRLRLYRYGFGGAEKLLSEVTTLEDGRYALPFDVGGKAASLEVPILDAAGREILLSKIDQSGMVAGCAVGNRKNGLHYLM